MRYPHGRRRHFDIPAVEAAISRVREIQVAVFAADRHVFQINPADVLVFSELHMTSRSEEKSR
jgi:hypothetical protein